MWWRTSDADDVIEMIVGKRCIQNAALLAMPVSVDQVDAVVAHFDRSRRNVEPAVLRTLLDQALKDRPVTETSFQHFLSREIACWQVIVEIPVIVEVPVVELFERFG